MKILCCGNLDWGTRPEDEVLIINRLTTLPLDVRLVHGGARGADLMCAAVAAKLNGRGWRFLIDEVRAQWSSFGRAAGPIRNARMLETGPDRVIAFFHDAPDKGTANMLKQARAVGIPIEVIG